MGWWNEKGSSVKLSWLQGPGTQKGQKELHLLLTPGPCHVATAPHSENHGH